MDPLTIALLQRQMGQPSAPQVPVIPPSGGATHTPPEAQRFATAQQMMQAYRQNWSPNPILTQITNTPR